MIFYQCFYRQRVKNFAVVKERQTDYAKKAANLSTTLFKHILGSLQSSAGCNQIINNKHFFALLNVTRKEP